MSTGGTIAVTLVAVGAVGGAIWFFTRKPGVNTFRGRPTAASITGAGVTAAGGRAVAYGRTPGLSDVHQEAARRAAVLACMSQGIPPNLCNIAGDGAAAVAKVEDKIIGAGVDVIKSGAEKAWNTVKGWF